MYLTINTSAVMGNRISLIHQAGALRSYFPQSQVTRKGEQELVWEGDLQPSTLGGLYRVRLVYTLKRGASVFVCSPTLKLAKGKTSLPHVYSMHKQELCLYYPKEREWHPGMYFVKSMIPWAVEWLYFYELWLVTDGVWLGGGIEHHEQADSESNKANESENEQ